MVAYLGHSSLNPELSQFVVPKLIWPSKSGTFQHHHQLSTSKDTASCLLGRLDTHQRASLCGQLEFVSRTSSIRSTKVNGSHRGGSPLLRPTGIRIATKPYATLQAMAPTNAKMVQQTSLLHIESSLDRLGMLSPTHDQRSQQLSGQITLQPVLINKFKFLNATHRTKIWKLK